MIKKYDKFIPVYEQIQKNIQPILENMAEAGVRIKDMTAIAETLHINIEDEELFLDGLDNYFLRLGIDTRKVYIKKGLEKSIMFKKRIHIKEISNKGLESLRKEITDKYFFKNVSLNRLLVEYAEFGMLVDVSVGAPNNKFDHGRWKDQLKRFKEAGAYDIVLIEVYELNYPDIVSLETHTIRIMVDEATIESLTKLQMAIEDLDPRSIDYQPGYIELFFPPPPPVCHCPQACL